MSIKFESKGGFRNVLKWLDDVTNIKDDVVKSIADEGVKCLKEGTPKESGETASGWVYEIVRKPNSAEIYWKNIANPESSVNVAKLIEFGHGTRTGGYVQPRPYIKRSMTPVWLKIDKQIEGLMR